MSKELLMGKNKTRQTAKPTRREFLQRGAAGALAAGLSLPQAAHGAVAVQTARRPNYLYILTDQLGLDAVAAHGCAGVNTPNIDRLVRRGVTFMESHSTNPVCSPARSSLMTGRMPTETGVITNSRPIHSSIPNIGQWLRQSGYDTAYCGKWHLPEGYPAVIDGFDVLPVGQGQGDLVDAVVSRACEAFLKNRSRTNPFMLVASFMQPHDICYWAIRNQLLVPKGLPFPQIAAQLPELPPNHTARPKAPALLAERQHPDFSEEQWRYYLYIYSRQVEMVDADIGRVLDALEATRQAENTVVILTADHGDGRGRHQHVSKWYPYDEAVKVPMIVSCPGTLAEGVRDTTHLVSGLDVMRTVCDCAGIAPPPDVLGMSLRPLLEQRPVQWREFVVADVQVIGRMVRTPQFKYVDYQDDPVEQLFDMQADPWETQNLYEDPKYASVLEDHRRVLDAWEGRLKAVDPAPSLERGQGLGMRRRKARNVS